MTAVSTSIDAFHDIRRSGSLSRQQSKILNAMQPGATYTRRELCKLTGFEVNVISGRVHELLSTGAIVGGKTKVLCPVTGRNVQGLRLPSYPGQAS